ncbi:endonuclease domain-containing protein [Paenibacillus albus]|uniref:endonuclease domain-containing protein n=1 Tax=Paenibacillus albus TaxID=2495582 RepID=UPI001D1321B8|nr:endonuclease domain-containing protein [Paenibacillus albus]
MNFQRAYQNWYEEQRVNAQGERKHRLEEGHGHAEKLFLEKVWYPAFRNFDDLQGEYEVADFKDGSRFLDFAFIQYPIKLAIEIDGYGAHSSKVTRWQFADSLMRQNHLIIDGWQILRFSYDEVIERPRMCEQTLQQFIGCWLGGTRSSTSGVDDLIEAEILRHALRLDRPLRPCDVMELLNLSRIKAYRVLHHLLQKKVLLPAGKGTQTIRGFLVNQQEIYQRE